MHCCDFFGAEEAVLPLYNHLKARFYAVDHLEEGRKISLQ